jgi:hypothetical protein
MSFFELIPICELCPQILTCPSEVLWSPSWGSLLCRPLSFFIFFAERVDDMFVAMIIWSRTFSLSFLYGTIPRSSAQIIIATNMSSTRSAKKMKKLRGRHKREPQEGLHRTSLGQVRICGQSSQIGMSSKKDISCSLRKDVTRAASLPNTTNDYLLQ